MKEIEIKHLAYLLKEAKKNKQPQPIFFLGAGASRSGNIPLADEIIEKILENYSESPFIKDLSKESRTYAKLMDCLLPDQRDELLKKYIDEAKINVTHIYLAQLLKEDFVDYVLTVNFDNLMLRALALYNIFPSTYDMAILKDFTTTTFKEKSVVYLHGQNHGLWLLNTPEEMEKVKNTVPRIFDTIKNKRPWVFIGYSGDDPIFKYVENLGRFNNGLYWVAYNNNNPNDNVQKLLSEPNTNAFIIKGYDADSFMLKLNSELGLGQPSIIDKPFTALRNMLSEIVDIDDKDSFKGVKERLEIAKRQVAEAIQQHELGIVEPEKELKDNSEIDLLKKEIINLIIAEKYVEEVIYPIEVKVKKIADGNLKNLLASLYLDWGTNLGYLARTKKDKEAEVLYFQSFEKYKKAVAIKPNNYEVYINWATDLGNLAKTKEGKEAEELYHQSFEKYKKVIEIQPSYRDAYYNWGTDLGNLARIKEGKEAEALYHQSFEKYKKVIEIEPSYRDAYYNWGTDLGNLAKTKEGKEAEALYYQSFEKYQKAIEIQADDHEAYYNWGTDLGYLARSKEGKEAEALYLQSFEKYKKAIEIKPDKDEAYNNWGSDLVDLAQTKEGKEAEILYHQSFAKYQKAIEIKPDRYETYYNWGISLGILAKTKEGKEAEELYRQLYEKYQKVIEIKPDYYEAYNNWGISLGILANTKEGKKAEALYHQSFEKYQKAIEIKPDYNEAYNNWGNDLGDLARITEGKVAESLYQQSFEKYQKAIEIKPDDHEAYYNWGTELATLAKNTEGEKSKVLYQQSIEKYQKGIEFGGACYNLACLYALMGNKNNALFYLDLSLSKKEITVSFILEDKDWDIMLQDMDFIEVIKKYQD